MDRRQAYRQRVNDNASQNIRPWLSIHILSQSIKRAKKHGWDIDIDLDYLVKLWNRQQGLCALSAMPMQTQSGTVKDKNPYRASLDRIRNDRGYVKGNVRFTCHWVNNAKSTWGDRIFNKFVYAIAESRS